MSLSTITNAMKHEPGSNWQIQGRLVDSQVFTIRKDGETRHLLKVLIVDPQGDVIEIKTWSKKKAFTIYRKFRLEQSVVVNGTAFFREPNRNYSMAKCECYSRWWIETIDDLRLEKYLQCVSSIDQFNKSKKPATIVGVFEGAADELMHPAKRILGGTVTIAQGLYIRCTGDNKNQFLLLVWFNPRERNPLFKCLPGQSIVLLPYARFQSEHWNVKTGNETVLTSAYPLVVDPSSINPKLVKKLKDVAAPLKRGRRPEHNPSVQTNGISQNNS